MVDTAISPELRTFLRERIHSYEHLELLLLARQMPTQAWSLDLAAKRLKVPEPAMLEAINDLCASDLLEMELDGRNRLYRYKPATPQLAVLCDELARTFAEERLALVRLMN